MGESEQPIICGNIARQSKQQKLLTRRTKGTLTSNKKVYLTV